MSKKKNQCQRLKVKTNQQPKNLLTKIPDPRIKESKSALSKRSFKSDYSLSKKINSKIVLKCQSQQESILQFNAVSARPDHVLNETQPSNSRLNILSSNTRNEAKQTKQIKESSLNKIFKRCKSYLELYAFQIVCLKKQTKELRKQHQNYKLKNQELIKDNNELRHQNNRLRSHFIRGIID